MIRKFSILKSDFIGIYARVQDDIALLPGNIEEEVEAELVKFLDVRPVKLFVENSYLVGSLTAMNSHGVIFPGTTENTIEPLDLGGRKVLFLKDKINAVGNDIVTSDRCALVHKNFSSRAVREIQDTLDVEVVKGTIGGIKTVGSFSVITKKGMIVTPSADEDEMKFLSDIFKVQVKQATANFGSMYLGASVIANAHGILVGEATTPIEIGRIEDALV